MSHTTNPKKGLGPVSNALCSGLNPVFLASHYWSHGEKITEVWEQRVRAMSGVPTASNSRPMTDDIFFSDRSYNSEKCVDFINDRIEGTVTGTYNRRYDFPFV